MGAQWLRSTWRRKRRESMPPYNVLQTTTLDVDIHNMKKTRDELERAIREEPERNDYIVLLREWEQKWERWVLDGQKLHGLNADIHPCLIARRDNQRCPYEPVSKCSLCWWLK